MKFITSKFIPWLMGLTRIMRYFVIALLVHVAILVVLGSIKIVAIVPKIVAQFTGAPLPPAATEEPDPYAAYRDFDYSGPTLGGGGGTPGKGPGGVPTAGGGTPENYQAHIVAPSAADIASAAGDVIGVESDLATAITRPTISGGAVSGPTFTGVGGMGDTKMGTGGIKGPGGGVYGARMGPMRSVALNKFQGSADTERAVLAALRWLKANQQADGSWIMPRQKPSAGSALAVLAFLGHGETPDSQEFGATVNKGLQYLVTCVPPNGEIPGRMYEQAFVAFALAEGYTMTTSPALREPLQRAVDVIISSQRAPKAKPSHIGGWRYGPTSNDSDTSVAGWMVLALKSAKNAGITIPQETFDKATQYFWNMYGGPGFGYSDRGSKPSTTAIGVLCMQFLGQGKDKRVKVALDFLQNQKVDWGAVKKEEWTVYGWYYMTLAMFQGGDPYWPYWNSQFRDTIVRNQNQDGSWTAPSTSREAGYGPVYTTTLCALMLEVYYRYLPMYQVLEQERIAGALPSMGATPAH